MNTQDKLKEVLLRRDFLKVAGGFTAVSAIGILLPGCESIDHLLIGQDVGNSPENLTTLTPGTKPLAPTPFRVSISSPTNLLLQGQQVTIAGKVTDSSGRPLKNELLGVNDGLTLWCTQTRTDNKGNIKYSAAVNARGAAVVEFLIRDYRYPFIFQSATKSGRVIRVKPLHISALAIQNNSSRDLKAITSVDNGPRYIHRVTKKRTLVVLQTIRDQAMKRVTVFGGGTFAVGGGAVGAEFSATVDNRGVGTISYAAGGAVFLRGQVYATTEGALGACWAPGGDLGVTPASLSGEIALCGGTDGISLGASGSSYGVTGGFSIQLLEWR